jgi:hypothetical protein
MHYHRLVDRKQHFRDKKALEREHNECSRTKLQFIERLYHHQGELTKKKTCSLLSFATWQTHLISYITHRYIGNNNIDNRKQNSAVLASFFLHEKLGTVGKVGCALCLIGSVVIVLHSPEEKNIESVDEILSYAMQPGMLCFLSLRTKKNVQGGHGFFSLGDQDEHLGYIGWSISNQFHPCFSLIALVQDYC